MITMRLRNNDRQVTQRLKELGFLPGAKLRVIGFGLFGRDPILVHINGTSSRCAALKPVKSSPKSSTPTEETSRCKTAAPIRFALVGNPNCGKTALFNRLTGARAKVANYAGVTVESAPARLAAAARRGVDRPARHLTACLSPR